MKVVIKNRNAFVGCLGHIASHSIFFTILFRLAIQFKFPFPFYILIWMSILMFFVGLFLSMRTFIRQLRNEHEKRFFSIQSGYLFLMYLSHSFHWCFMMFSQLYPESIPILNLVVFYIATDNISTCFLSFTILKRKMNTNHLISILTGLLGILFANFLKIQQLDISHKKVMKFKLDFNFSQTSLQVYTFLIISRFSYIFTSVIYKRALLQEASIQRFRAFKLSPYRHLKLFDFEPNSDIVGELIKPTVSENSRVFIKSQYQINLRKLVADEMQMSRDPMDVLDKMEEIIEEIDNVEKVKVMRQSAVSERQKEIVLQELRDENVPSEINILEYYNKWSKLLIKAPAKYDKLMTENEDIKMKNQQATIEKEKQDKQKDPDQDLTEGYNAPPINKPEKIRLQNITQDEQTDKQYQLRRLWAVAMSEEMQELLKDYKNYSLHEHLFDGDDDLQLTKLDLLFDDQTFDFEIFGKEEPSHQLLMSFIGGMLAVPLYLIMNFMSLNKITIDSQYPPVSFMGIIEAYRYPAKFHFYEQMFASRWENILIVLAIAILYMLKPLASTRFILSLSPSHGALSYIMTEIFSKVFFVFVSTVCIDKQQMVGKLQAFGLIIALMSQLVYYWASQDGGRKHRIEIQSASQAVREVFHYEKPEQLSKVNYILRQLDPAIGALECTDIYSLLLDAILSKNPEQLASHLNFSTLHSQRYFDLKHHKNTCLWGGGYPRPSNEHLGFTYVIKDNAQFEQIPRDQLFQIQGTQLYNLASFNNLKQTLQQTQVKQTVQEDLQSEPIKKTTFARNKKRRQALDTSTPSNKLNDDSNNEASLEDNRMHTTQNLLMDTTVNKTLEIKDHIEKEQQLSLSDNNQSSVILDELSDNYTDGLDDKEDAIEVDFKNYDEVEQTVQIMAVSKSQFYKPQDQEEEEPQRQKGGAKKKKKKTKAQGEEDEFSKQFKMHNRKQSLVVEDIK